MKSILDLIEFSKTLENINKKALYIYIKEMTGIDKSYKIANVIKKMKEPFFIFKENYITSHGKILSGSLKHSIYKKER
jgi:excinuclease UvrABC helicase subunit UvrB